MVITTIYAGEILKLIKVLKKILNPNILIHKVQLISIRNLAQQITFLCFSFKNSKDGKQRQSKVRGDRVNVPQEVSYIITIIIDSNTFPFTVLLKVLVIMAVKTRPTNTSCWPV